MSAPDGIPSGSLDDQRIASLRAAIAGWFLRGHRDLPWRRTRDPYAVWISEVMLQQTRAETVAPRFTRWMARFPTAAALAEAPLDDVLAEWAGLGYYARARNLHAAARRIAEEHAGRVPDTDEGVAALPGVGRYTAGAILSIAYGRAVPLLDGNVERVLCRLFRIDGDPRGPAVRERLWELAARLVRAPGPEQHGPSQLNQGLMELGAVICTPRRPACLACPVEKECQARRAGEAEELPRKGRAQKVTALSQVSVALLRRGKLLLLRRPASAGLWGGLFELPTGEVLPGESTRAAARRVLADLIGLEVEPRQLSPLPPPADRFEHVLSHRRITFHGLRADAPDGRVRRRFHDDHRWVAPDLGPGSLGVSRATTILLGALAPAPAATRHATSRRPGRETARE